MSANIPMTSVVKPPLIFPAVENGFFSPHGCGIAVARFQSENPVRQRSLNRFQPAFRDGFGRVGR